MILAGPRMTQYCRDLPFAPKVHDGLRVPAAGTWFVAMGYARYSTAPRRTLDPTVPTQRPSNTSRSPAGYESNRTH